jgi:hypothetical protein
MCDTVSGNFSMLSALIFEDGCSVGSAYFSHALDDSIIIFFSKRKCFNCNIDKYYYSK